MLIHRKVMSVSHTLVGHKVCNLFSLFLILSVTSELLIILRTTSKNRSVKTVNVWNVTVYEV
jgi:hypothetical protein